LLTQLRWVAKLTTQLVTGKALPQGLRPREPPTPTALRDVGATALPSVVC